MTCRTPPLRSSVGLTVFGDNRFRGLSVRDEVTGFFGVTELLMLAVAGTRPSRDEVAILEDLAAAHCSCDLRIPPIKLARVVASFGGAIAGQAAAALGFTGQDIGARAGERCARLLLEVATVVDGQPDRDRPAAISTEVKRRLAVGERLAGFGAALRPADERVQAFRASLERRGLLGRPWFRLADQVAAAAHAAARLQPNGAFYGGAAFLEVGLKPEQMGLFATVLFQHSFAGIVQEGAVQDEAQLRRLPVECVNYAGPVPRSSPRALAYRSTRTEEPQ